MLKLETRTERAKFNTITSFLYQFTVLICGFVMPRLLIGAFGSEAYGATASITRFLSYISLIEGGIGGVARAELYKPLAEHDDKKISSIYYVVRSFFGKVGIAFVAYAFAVALLFHRIADITFWDRSFTFALVIVISISTVWQYFFGIANLTLLNASQKLYINYMLSAAVSVVNTLLAVLLVNMGCSILTVKLCGSVVFIVRPLIFTWYVRRHYSLTPTKKKDNSVLSQRWTGFGQHIAYFLQNNVDVFVLTLFSDMSSVAVYSVYHLILNSIRNITTSFAGGMEAVFGDIIAKNELEVLKSTYERYKLILTVSAFTLFGTAGIMIIPFVRIYTAGVADTDYIRPLFAVLLMLAEAVNCFVLPCSTMPVSANKFKETKWGAYGEAEINGVLSLLLVFADPLTGVAAATLISVLFKSIYYMIYAAKNILFCKASRLIANFTVSTLLLACVTVCGMMLVEQIEITDYFTWVLVCVPIVLGLAMTAVLMGGCMYPRGMKELVGRFLRPHRR